MSNSTNYTLNTSNGAIFDIFEKLRNEKKLFDLELVAGGQKFQAHTFLLCTFSPFLHKMLIGKENRNSVRFNDIKAFTMESILKLVYEKRVVIPKVERMDKALALLGIDFIITEKTEKILIYELNVGNDIFTTMKKSLWGNFHKPDVRLFSQCGKSIPVHFSVLYLHCRHYQEESSIPCDVVDVLPSSVSYDALMEAVKLIYTGKLKSNVDKKLLKQTFGFLGINFGAQANNPSLHLASPYPIDHIYGRTMDELNYFPINLTENYPFMDWEPFVYPYSSAGLAPEIVHNGRGVPSIRSAPPNAAQSVSGSRTLPMNIPLTRARPNASSLRREFDNLVIRSGNGNKKCHFVRKLPKNNHSTTQLIEPASNTTGSVTSDAAESSRNNFSNVYGGWVASDNEFRLPENHSSAKKNKTNDGDPSREFYDRFE